MQGVGQVRPLPSSEVSDGRVRTCGPVCGRGWDVTTCGECEDVVSSRVCSGERGVCC